MQWHIKLDHSTPLIDRFDSTHRNKNKPAGVALLQ
jgi:hypothetical protein